jgi:fructose-1,6-bisphosphatase-3
MDIYGNDPCHQFWPKLSGGEEYTDNELNLMAQMHKAITIIQLKVEGQIIRRRPHYQMEGRLLLDKINYDSGTILLDGQEYQLNDANFPTIDPERPYNLTEREQSVVKKMKLAFGNSEKLQKHVRFLYAKGSMYLVYNGNLLYHGCIAMNKEGTFKAFKVGGQEFAAKAFMVRIERLIRQGYFAKDPEQKLYGLDAMWYTWCGDQSPLFGKDKMTTFERYFIDDQSTHKELRNAYYTFRDREDVARRILKEFGLDPDSAHIINGHVPVKVNKGESPVKAEGKLIVIDGGFSKAYQTQTGIAGYTLVYNSYGLLLASHHPFESAQKAITEELDIHSKTEILETNYARIRVKDTDQGREIQRQIEELQALLKAYQAGLITEE